MAVEHASQRSIEQLSDRELSALVEAAAWYAKYHEQSVSATIGDDSATAHVRRERFRDLHSALRQLGVRLRLPNGFERV
jgi:hypothetical protein